MIYIIEINETPSFFESAMRGEPLETVITCTAMEGAIEAKQTFTLNHAHSPNTPVQNVIKWMMEDAKADVIRLQSIKRTSET